LEGRKGASAAEGKEALLDDTECICAGSASERWHLSLDLRGIRRGDRFAA